MEELEKKEINEENNTNFENEESEEITLDENSLIEFQQTLDKEDLYFYNVYLSSKRMLTTVFRLLIGITGIILMVTAFVEKEYVYIGLSLLLVLYAIFIRYFQNKLLRRTIDRRAQQNIEIVVKVADNGFVYRLPQEKDIVVGWQFVQKAISYPNYIYIHLSAYSVVILKKQAYQDFSAVENLVEEQLGTGARFFVKEK